MIERIGLWHAVLPITITLVGAIALVLCAVAALRRQAGGASLAVAIGILGWLLAAQALLGGALALTGAPVAPLHLIYGVLAAGAIPLLRRLVPDDAAPTTLLVIIVLALALAWRASATGH
jgi:hypothetical protein